MADALLKAICDGDIEAARSIQVDVPEETQKALTKALDKGDLKTAKWIVISIIKGYEGAGVILYTDTGYILGVNREGSVEYPGGKVEEGDIDMVDTAQRELREETGLNLDRERFGTKCSVSGGVSGFSAHVFLVKITEEEFASMTSDGTFTKFIQVPSIVDCDTVTCDGVEYPIRKFNRLYVIPQIKQYLH